jgi:hypothetical protein
LNDNARHSLRCIYCFRRRCIFLVVEHWQILTVKEVETTKQKDIRRTSRNINMTIAMLHGVLLCYQFWSVFDGENWNRTWYRGCRGYYGSTGYNVRVTTFSYNAVEIYRKLILLFNIRGMYSFGHPKSPQNDLFSMYQDRIPFT